MSDPVKSNPDQDPEERLAVLHQLEDWVQTPMVVLSFVWLLLVLVEFVWGASKLLETFGIAIWIVFLAEFALRFALAPDKRLFLRSNIITIFALAVPAFRLLRAFRLFRLARAARSLRLVKIIGAANRGMGALRASLGRRGLGYVLAFTVFVTLLGAAGMLAFESAAEVERGFSSYPDALWWTAMLLTTMGSEFWPQTPEGRLLCLLLSLYGFAVFGYITASFGSFFIERDAVSDDTEILGTKDLAALRDEIASLREALSRDGDLSQPRA
jgi:voltage-gated potassium channel